MNYWYVSVLAPMAVTYENAFVFSFLIWGEPIGRKKEKTKNKRFQFSIILHRQLLKFSLFHYLYLNVCILIEKIRKFNNASPHYRDL